MTQRTLIKHGTVVLPTETTCVNVLLEGGKIAALDVPSSVRHDESVDAEGLHLIPGAIDDQVHFRDPGSTHKEDLRSGPGACVAGGVTSFLEMPNTNPQTISVQALTEKLELASSKSVANFGFYIGATVDNVAELKAATRTPGIKIFIGSSTGNMLVDRQEALESIFAETTLPITAHCEDEATVQANALALGGGTTVEDHSRIRDTRAAVTATKRALDLAQRHDHRFHVLHVSTADEVPLIQAARGLVTAEVCPHHLFFDTTDYERLGSRVQMNPSVKAPTDRRALWDALVEGHIQIVATDHAPHTLEEKAAPYPASPSGVPAVELLLPLMLNQVAAGECTLEDVVRWMCSGPARVWDIVDKGRIQEGYDADLVLVDLREEREVRNEAQWTKSGWSPWHGTKLTGWPVRTWVGGRTVFQDGNVNFDVPGREIVFDHERGGYWATAND
ncbi:MAG: dihydroorotase [Longimicrobiales bacterium]